MSASAKTAFLVYRPVLDYEESEEAHLITLSEETAKRIVAEVQQHAEELCAKLKPELSDELSDEEWCANADHNSKVISESVWPYGIDYHSDLHDDQHLGWKAASNFIAYRALPLIEEGGQG